MIFPFFHFIRKFEPTMIAEVQNHYNENAHTEWERLTSPYSRVEFTTTLWLIEKYFPKTGKILDVGSGPGRYSLALAEKGFEVTLADISQNELDLAEKNFAESGLAADGFVCTCASDLSAFEDNSFDGVLVMGPMYHIHCEDERIQVLREARRVLKPHGTALIAFINNFGALKSSVTEFPFSDDDWYLFEQISKGKMKLSHEEAFTSTCFVRPEDAIREIEEASLELMSYAGAESFLSGMSTDLSALHDNEPEKYELYLKMACEVCEYPQFRDATEHLNIVVRKGE